MATQEQREGPSKEGLEEEEESLAESTWNEEPLAFKIFPAVIKRMRMVLILNQ